jgi:transcription elongation factor Elf1
MCNNVLPTKANLLRRKIVENLLCHICGLEAETMGHILWSYPEARDAWSMWKEATKELSGK